MNTGEPGQRPEADLAQEQRRREEFRAELRRLQKLAADAHAQDASSLFAANEVLAHAEEAARAAAATLSIQFGDDAALIMTRAEEAAHDARIAMLLADANSGVLTRAEEAAYATAEDAFREAVRSVREERDGSTRLKTPQDSDAAADYIKTVREGFARMASDGGTPNISSEPPSEVPSAVEDKASRKGEGIRIIDSMSVSVTAAFLAFLASLAILVGGDGSLSRFATVVFVAVFGFSYGLSEYFNRNRRRQRMRGYRTHTTVR